MVFEYLGVTKLGEKIEPFRSFEGKAIAKVVRSNHDVDHVAVKWDEVRERPYVVFDPNTGRGMIMEYIFFYTYDWQKIREKEQQLEQESKRIGSRPIHDMDLTEINLELIYVHGITEELLNQYLTVHSRRALLAQKRFDYESKAKKR